jgi:hypothetical protein
MANRKRRQPDDKYLVGGVKMGDNTVTLSNGRVLTIDLYKMTMREYRTLFDTKIKPEKDDVIYSKVLGLTTDELTDLPQPDWQRACLAVIDAARKPLSDPNSASASSSA